MQIWEDPWYYDLYGKKSKKVKKAESKLLIAAEKIYYVSPLTLTNQKIFFPKAANKMSVIPLPSMDNNENDKEKDFFVVILETIILMYVTFFRFIILVRIIKFQQ